MERRKKSGVSFFPVLNRIDVRMGPIAERFKNPAGVAEMRYQELRYWYNWAKAFFDNDKEHIK